jgi:quercetin dioxygenase-like cupin family protein
MLTVKKLLIVIVGAVIFSFCLGLQPVYAQVEQLWRRSNFAEIRSYLPTEVQLSDAFAGYTGKTEMNSQSSLENNREETSNALLEKQQDLPLVVPNGVFLSSPAQLGSPNVVTGAYTGGQYEVLEGLLPPGVATEPHRHFWNTEAFYILKGSAAFQLGDRTFIAKAGDFVFIPKKKLHAWRNLGQTPDAFRTLLINNPAGLTKLLLKLGLQGTEEYYKNLVTISPNYGTEVQDSLCFTDTEYSVNEDGTPIAAVTVRRIGKSEEPASATIVLSDGTAKLGEDYSTTEIPIHFAPQETVQSVVIPISIINDDLVEGNETINLTLKNATGSASIPLLQNKAILTIVDNNAPVENNSNNTLTSLQEFYNLPLLQPNPKRESFSWRGSTATVIATGEDTEGQFSLFDVLVPPQTELQPYINHQENEGFYILDGSISFQIDGQTITATPGSYVFVPKDQSYTFGNLETTPARLALITTPRFGSSTNVATHKDFRTDETESTHQLSRLFHS